MHCDYSLRHSCRCKTSCKPFNIFLWFYSAHIHLITRQWWPSQAGVVAVPLWLWKHCARLQTMPLVCGSSEPPQEAEQPEQLMVRPASALRLVWLSEHGRAGVSARSWLVRLSPCTVMITRRGHECAATKDPKLHLQRGVPYMCQPLKHIFYLGMWTLSGNTLIHARMMHIFDGLFCWYNLISRENIVYSETQGGRIMSLGQKREFLLFSLQKRTNNLSVKQKITCKSYIITRGMYDKYF